MFTLTLTYDFFKISTSVSSNENSIDLIKDGSVLSALTNFVTLLESTTNRSVKFQWRVFELGSVSFQTSNLLCELKIEKTATGDTTTILATFPVAGR